MNEVNQVPYFHFQNTLDLIDCNSVFGKSKSYEKLNFEDIAEVDGVLRFTNKPNRRYNNDQTDEYKHKKKR